MFGKIAIPPEVNKEILELERFGVSTLEYQSCGWIEIIAPTDEMEVQGFLGELDRGEAEAIVLARELGANFLIIDERLGAQRVKDEGLTTMGLVGVLIKAKERGLIREVKPILYELRDITGFWMSDRFLAFILRKIGE